MVAKYVYKKRILKLADFLRGRVNPKLFSLRVVIDNKETKAIASLKKEVKLPIEQQHTCGTTACAMGYTPIVFPKLIKFTGPGRFFDLQMPNGESLDYVDAACYLFGMSSGDALRFFSPDTSNAQDLYGVPTIDDVTPQMVADKLTEYANNL